MRSTTGSNPCLVVTWTTHIEVAPTGEKPHMKGQKKYFLTFLASNVLSLLLLRFVYLFERQSVHMRTGEGAE